MKITQANFYKDVCKLIALEVVAIIACRLTSGNFLAVVAIFGLYSAITAKVGWAVSSSIFLAIAMDLNPNVLPHEGVAVGFSSRFGILLIGIALGLVGMKRNGTQTLRFGYMLPFLFIAMVSSSLGWAPLVSQLKLVNFLVFLFSFGFGLRNMQLIQNDLVFVRKFIFATCALIVIGSAISILDPAIAYHTSLKNVIRQEGLEGATAYYYAEAGSSSFSSLFGGITNQSQTLAPILSCMVCFVLCDMLFIERRFDAIRFGLLLLMHVMSYATRSRTGLFSLLIADCMCLMYLPRKISIPSKIRQWVTHISVLMVALVISAGALVEVRGDGISRWLRKTNDVAGDTRTLQEAVTTTRQGLIDMSISDFRRNPWVGMGFQVAEYTNEFLKYNNGAFILSSPIEKGVLPVMILGETGVFGFIAFIVFLLCFWSDTASKHNYITLSMFAVMISTNAGEATFFSPGGTGGTLWWISVGGGFCLDTILKSGVCNDFPSSAHYELPRNEYLNSPSMNARH